MADFRLAKRLHFASIARRPWIGSRVRAAALFARTSVLTNSHREAPTTALQARGYLQVGPSRLLLAMHV